MFLLWLLTLVGSWFAESLAADQQTLKQQNVLSKKYTLLVPMMSPISGAVSPGGAFCTESIEMSLDAINRSPDILPNYNLAVDLGDDQCTDAPAVKVALKMFLNFKPVVNLTLPESIQGELRPLNSIFSRESAKNGYIAPLFLGGLCSQSCVPAARFSQQFNFIDVAHTCNDPSLDNRAKFRNFYRFFPSSKLTADVRVQFLQIMKWRKAAIIADSFPISYSDAFALMTFLQQANIEIAAQEYFIDDANEAISRLKESGARIIFATCYSCPLIACAAYQQGLFGPKYVWIFRPNADISSPGIARPPGCTKAMTDAFAERTIYVGGDNEGSTLDPDKIVTEAGVTLRQYQQFIASKTKGLQPRGGGQLWRMFCFEHVNIAANILHSVELELNKNNKTLKDVVPDVTKQKELEELVRQKTITLDIQGLYGRVAFQPNTTDPYTPVIMAAQLQNGVRIPVWILNNPCSPNMSERFQMIATPKWDTLDGKPPKGQPSFVTEVSHVESGFVIANWFFGGLIIIAIITLEVCRSTNTANSRGVIMTSDFITLATSGAIFVQAAVFTFPLQSQLHFTAQFCQSATVLILLGFTLLAASLTFKLWIDKSLYIKRRVMTVSPQIFNVRSSIIPSTPCFQRVKDVQSVFWLFALILCLIIGWYLTSIAPGAANFVSVQRDQNSDVIYEYSWTSCVLIGSSSTWLAAILSVLGFVLLTGIVAAVKYRRSSYSAEWLVKEVSVALYVLASIVAVCVIAVKVLSGAYAMFGVMTAFCYACSLTTVLILFRETTFRVFCPNKYQRRSEAADANRQNVSTILGTGQQFNLSTLQSGAV